MCHINVRKYLTVSNRIIELLQRRPTESKQITHHLPVGMSILINKHCVNKQPALSPIIYVMLCQATLHSKRKRKYNNNFLLHRLTCLTHHSIAFSAKYPPFFALLLSDISPGIPQCLAKQFIHVPY